MPRTVRNLIEDALKVQGVLAAGASLPDAHAEDGLSQTRLLLDGWNAARVAIGVQERLTVTWTANQRVRTLAASGADLAVARPLAVDLWSVIPSGETDEAFSAKPPLTRQQYNEIPDKTTTGSYFTELHYEPTPTSGTASVYPVPTTAPTLVLYVPKAHTSDLALGDTLAYAPGAEQAVLYALAKRLGPIFHRPWTKELAELSAIAWRQWVIACAAQPEPKRNSPFLRGAGTFNIETGQFR